MFSKKRPLNLDKIENDLNSLVKVQVIKLDLGERNTLEITLSLSEYLYSDLKEILKDTISVLKENGCNKSIIRLFLTHNDEIKTNGNYIEAKNSVDIFETIKSRLPSASKVIVDRNNISFAINDLENIARTALSGALVLVDHFNEELPNGASVSVNINDEIGIKFDFTWLQTKVINETVINSVRYHEMMEFLQQNPHPQVKTFLFRFRDSNKGFYAELNMLYKDDVSSNEALKISDFIRSKLNERFSHLPVY